MGLLTARIRLDNALGAEYKRPSPDRYEEGLLRGSPVNSTRMHRVWSVFGILALGAGLALGGVSCKGSDSSSASGNGSPSAAAVDLVGTGATFPEQIYKQWFKDYNADHTNVTVEYQGKGSGGGIKDFTAGTTDFGASDAAMTDDEISKVAGGVVLLPMTAGEVVLIYNLDGVPDLKLSRAAYSGIFLGTIKKWNDPAIASVNSGVTLPDEDISTVHRGEGSGTTFCFTTHLTAISKDWASGPGAGKTVNWPNGVGGKGNDGVAAAVKGAPGAIGYVEFGYAMSKNLAMAELENKAAKYVKATPEAGAAALSHVDLPDNLRAWAPDPDGDDSYPIVTYTWLLAHPSYTDAAKGNALKDIIHYGLTDGQKISTKLGYIPLPDAVVQKVQAAADSIKAGG
jgi:phosphate transport system substrate-binding protein